MPDRLFFVFPGESSETYFEGRANITQFIPQPKKLAANQVIGYYIPAGEKAPPEIKSSQIWHLPDNTDRNSLILEGLQFTHDVPSKLQITNSGFLTTIEGKMKVTKLYEIFDDIDARTGDIKVDSSILLHGTITQGIEIISGGDIETRGLVEDATLRAKGSIVAKGGISSNGKGKIVAGGNLYSTFIQQADIEVMENILVDGSIINSNILCGKKVVIRKKGLLVGGKVMARDGIEALHLGTEAAITTEVEIGCNPFQRTHIERIEKEIVELEQGMKTMIVQIKHLEHELMGFVKFQTQDLATSLFSSAEFVQKEGGDLGEEKIHQINKFGSGIMRLMRMTGEVEQLKEELKRVGSSETYSKKARIHVGKTAHPGVTLKIQNTVLKLMREYDHVTFYYSPEKGEIVAGF